MRSCSELCAGGPLCSHRDLLKSMKPHAGAGMYLWRASSVLRPRSKPFMKLLTCP